MNKLLGYYKRIDWINSLFLFSTPIIALIGFVYLWKSDAILWQTVVLSVIMAFLTGLAITAGYHRLFAHKSYEANWFFKLMVLCFGAAAFENSAIRWSADHRTHHKYVDTDLDPYNIERGFFFAHMGWVCLKENPAMRFNNTPDLEKDPLVRFQANHIFSIGIFFSFIFPMAIAAMWGDALGGLILAGFVRLVLNHHFTFSINSWCHMIGRQPYSDRNSARDSWFLALFTYGEGYHNFHHSFPSDYRNGIRHYHWDPTKWLVKGLSWFGMTFQLRKISDEKIILARLRMNEKRLVRQVEKKAHAHNPITKELVTAARLKFENAYVRFQVLKKEYALIKESKMIEINQRIDTVKADLHQAQTHLHEAVNHWKELCQRYGVRPVTATVVL